MVVDALRVKIQEIIDVHGTLSSKDYGAKKCLVMAVHPDFLSIFVAYSTFQLSCLVAGTCGIPVTLDSQTLEQYNWVSRRNLLFSGSDIKFSV